MGRALGKRKRSVVSPFIELGGSSSSDQVGGGTSSIAGLRAAIPGPTAAQAPSAERRADDAMATARATTAAAKTKQLAADNLTSNLRNGPSECRHRTRRRSGATRIVPFSRAAVYAAGARNSPASTQTKMNHSETAAALYGR